MAHSTVVQEGLPLAVGATYLGFMTQLPPVVVIGAFTGAIIFLLGVSDKPKWQWMLLFTVAFITGLLGYTTVCGVIEGALGLISVKAKVPEGMGAMASAACTINFISWMRDNPGFFFRRGKEDKA